MPARLPLPLTLHGFVCEDGLGQQPEQLLLLPHPHQDVGTAPASAGAVLPNPEGWGEVTSDISLLLFSGPGPSGTLLGPCLSWDVY